MQRAVKQKQTAETPAGAAHGAEDATTAAAAASSSPAAAPPIAGLPPSILRHVLGLLSLGFRLGTCSLVHSTWAAAAAEATTAIQVPRNRWREQSFESLSAWLRRRASPQLVSLSLQGASAHVLLPGPTAGMAGRLSTVLSGLTRLTSLILDGHDAFAAQQTDISSSPELPDFLAGLGHLTSLHTLNLTGTVVGYCEWAYTPYDRDVLPSASQQAHVEQSSLQVAKLCAGLLASTSLTRLQIKSITLPAGCGAHMFGRPGLRLPHLAEIYLESAEKPSWGSRYTPKFYLTPRDVSSIATCCEGGCLRSLTLLEVVQRGADFSALSVLTTLTRLSLHGSPTKGIDKLVSLQELDLMRGELTDATLAGIALQLTRVTEFSQWNMQLSERAAVSDLVADLDEMIGFGMTYTQEGEEEEPVYEMLARDLRRAGILPKRAR